ncbi:MAG: extracellular solute-binding protein, partial [Firmicutes bacterium]|nr:extracellular solute-binding protein [Bacillota bacterium]
PGNFFNAEQCIFAIDSTAGATWIGADSPNSDISKNNTLQFETVVKTIPQYDTENPKMISQGPSMCVFNKNDPHEVLASWLFAQFMLTNQVQLGYSQTEGYVPVTTKAQESAEYQEYLSKIGQDNDLHYDVKIKAAHLLMDNTENTFVTPVFNGSTSLRDTAGQMIENVTKSVRRKEVVDDAYIEKLYGDMTSLYRLDQQGGSGGIGPDAENLGPLPAASKALLGTLAGVWVLIIGYVIRETVKKKNGVKTGE